MKLGKTLYVADRAKWRHWLAKNHKTETEIWLVYFKEGSGKPRLLYNDAVEEALCFGWIDSTVKKLDERRFAQRFSPRKPNSPYSQANKERLARLSAAGKVSKDVLRSLENASLDAFQFPDDILNAIRAKPQAWRNYQGFSNAYKRIRVAFVESARSRPKEFKKRLDYFVKMTELGKQFGFGGIEKYY